MENKMVNLAPYKHNLAKYSAKSNYITYDDPRDAFITELQNNGFSVKTLTRIGDIERVSVDGDTGAKKSGWYIYHEIEDKTRDGHIGIGVYGNWRDGGDKRTWVSKKSHAMTDAERTEYTARIEEIQAAREAELLKMQAETATRAIDIWNKADMATVHPYLDKKGIRPHGTKIIDNILIIPVFNSSGDIMTLQRIFENGEKRFLSGGKTKGGYYYIGEHSPYIYVCEGFATGASINEATGSMVYIAFNAGNLADVTGMAVRNHPDCQVIVAGDDDVKDDGGFNTGRSKATASGELYGCPVIFPDTPSDFNDMAKAKGLDNLKKFLNDYAKKDTQTVRISGDMPPHLEHPQGALGEIVNYYMASARCKNIMFAVNTALAIGSIVTARMYRTNKNNFSSVYIINVARSGIGKEHIQTVIEKMLEAFGLAHLIAGDGYTSSSAVISKLMSRPRHITIMDEFADYLQAMKAKGNSNLVDANTSLVKAFSKLHSYMRSRDYSTAMLTKEQKKAMENRNIVNPAITIVASTTPRKFIENLSMGQVADGFLNRFIISFSDAKRGEKLLPDDIEVPLSIIEWAQRVTNRYGGSNVAESHEERPNIIDLYFDDAAMAAYSAYEERCRKLADKLEENGLEEMPSRAAEIALRLSIPVALSRDPDTETINGNDLQWCIDYVDFHLNKTLSMFKKHLSGSEHERERKEVWMGLRAIYPRGILRGDMTKKSPYNKYDKKKLNLILEELFDAGLVSIEKVENGMRGRNPSKYFAIEKD